MWPIADVSRAFATARTWSQSTSLGRRRPPSGGFTRTRNGRSRRLEVKGTTTTSCEGPELYVSAETIRSGLTPACLRPTVGLRLPTHSSPRSISLVREVPLLVWVEAVHQGFIEFRELFKVLCPPFWILPLHLFQRFVIGTDQSFTPGLVMPRNHGSHDARGRRRRPLPQP